MKKFEETVKGALVGNDTKKVVKAASDGNLEEYKKAIGSYSWPRTRDYTMVLLIFSPIVAAINAVNKMENADDDSNDTNDKFQKLAPLVDKILTHKHMLNLCKHIGEGKGKDIKDTLNQFTEYKNLLKMLTDNKYGTGGGSDKFIERAGKITSWVRNGSYINEKLIPFVKGILGSKFASSITKGLQYFSYNRGVKYGRGFTETHSGDYLTFDDLKITGEDDVQTLSSEKRKRGLETGRLYTVPDECYLTDLPSRIRITPEMREFFKNFEEPLEKNVLYITEDKLCETLRQIITTKVSTYQNLDDVAKVYEKYIGLYSPKHKNRFRNKRQYQLRGQVAERLLMKYVMDRIQNFDKTRNIDFNRFRNTLQLIYETDKSTYDAAADEFKRHYGLEITMKEPKRQDNNLQRRNSLSD